jgi:hypothetical protein
VNSSIYEPDTLEAQNYIAHGLGRVILVLKVGDQTDDNPSEGLRDAYPANVIDDNDWGHKVDISDWSKKVYAHIIVPRSQKSRYLNMLENNGKTGIERRERINKINLQKLSVVLGDSNIETEWRSERSVPIYDIRGKNIDSCVEITGTRDVSIHIPDGNSIFEGAFSVGSGGDYTTWLGAYGDVPSSGLTDNLTFTQISAITETAGFTSFSKLNGFTFKATSNVKPLGNRNGGWITSINHTSNAFRFATGSSVGGKHEIDGLSFKKITSSSGRMIYCSTSDATIHLHDSVLDGNLWSNELIHMVSSTGNEIYNNLFLRTTSSFSNSRSAIHVGSTASADVYNNFITDCGVGVYWESSSGSYIGNIAFNCLTSLWTPFSGVTVTNNADDDSKLPTGSGNKKGLTPASEVDTVLTSDTLGHPLSGLVNVATDGPATHLSAKDATGVTSWPGDGVDDSIGRIQFAIPDPGPDPPTEQTIHYAAEIDITDQTTDTDTSRGLWDGFFRWVTERPQYDGGTVIPTGENDGNKWKDSILIGRKQLSPVDRIININRAGDYGSLSGFNLAIDNTSDFEAAVVGFDDYLRQNNLNIINRPMKIYAVIDDVFTQIWGGVVSETKYNEKVYEFIGKDIFEKAHKSIPPEEITLQTFPEADKDLMGKSIPVVFGDMLRTELFNITGKSEPITVGIKTGRNLKVCASAIIQVLVSGDILMTLKTPFISWPTGFFQSGDYYINVVKGTDQAIRIIDSEATQNPGTTGATTRIILGKMFDGITINDFNSDAAYPISGDISDDVWFFEIIKMNVDYLLSNKEIHDLPTNDKNQKILTKWNGDTLLYDPITELYTSSDITDTNKYNKPFVDVINNNVELDGDFVRLIPIVPETIELESFSINTGTVTTNTLETNKANLIDLSVSSDAAELAVAGNERTIVTYIATLPDEFVINSLEKLYILPDFTVTGGSVPKSLTLTIGAFGPYGDKQYDTTNGSLYPTITTDYDLKMLPSEYWKDFTRESDFGKDIAGFIISDFFLVPEVILSSYKDSLASGQIFIQLRFQSAADTFSLKFNEIGFFGTQKINVVKTPNYIKAKGELVNGEETNTVRNAFHHIMETYDGIALADIDFGNLDLGTRNSWKVGRQLSDRRLSSVYLKELAAQSYVGIFPTRQGKRGLKSFLDDDAPIWTHANDNGTIIKGSILSFVDTPINEVYNDFKIEYDWNPGLKKFNQSIFITNTDARTEVDPYSATFPDELVSTGVDQDFTLPAQCSSVNINVTGADGWAVMVSSPTWAEVGGAVSFQYLGSRFSYAIIDEIDGNNVYFTFATQGEITPGAVFTLGTLTAHGTNIKKWTTWVGGINSYITAKEYWEVCYNSWLKTQTVNKLPESLGKCYWYIDSAVFNNVATSTDDSAAHKYLANLVSWSTRQKSRVVYRIPITADNIEIEMLDPVSFTDQKYTNGNARIGYIEKIKEIPSSDSIQIQAILRPTDLESPYDGLIIETGSAPTTITETGSRPDTITETGV